MPRRIGDPARRRRHFIKEWRDLRGFSQQKLADLLDTDKASISRIEDLKQGYTQDSLEAMADVLGTHVGTLLTRAPNDAEKAEAAKGQKAPARDDRPSAPALKRKSQRR